MKNVVFFGSKTIGANCLEQLAQNQLELGINLIGVLTNNRGSEVQEVCDRFNINVIPSLQDLLLLSDLHVGISVQYHEILKKAHIEKFEQAIVNLHMAPLPEYRGCNQFSFALINGEEQFGTTIHMLEEGIDSGPILFERRFAIPEQCWIEDLVKLTEEESLSMFRSCLPALIEGRYQMTAQDSLLDSRGTQFHLRSEIESVKTLDIGWSEEKFFRHLRALSMPGFEPPHILINGRKIFLDTKYEDSTS